MTVGVLTTCHTQYTSDSSICIFLLNRTTLQVFVTYLTGALYVHPLWFYKHQHDNRVHSTRYAFSLLFAAILVNCAPSGEMHNYCTPRIIKENFENFLIHRCNYILLSEVYCVWQVVKIQTIILNNPVLLFKLNTGICVWTWITSALFFLAFILSYFASRFLSSFPSYLSLYFLPFLSVSIFIHNCHCKVLKTITIVMGLQ